MFNVLCWFQIMEYLVEKILDKRSKCGKIEYFLKWVDYSEDQNSWEPAENLHCEELIKKFEQKLEQLNNQLERRSTPTSKNIGICKKNY